MQDDIFEQAIKSDPNLITEMKDLTEDQINQWFDAWGDELGGILYQSRYVSITENIHFETIKFLIRNYAFKLTDDQLTMLMCTSTELGFSWVVYWIPTERITSKISARIILRTGPALQIDQNDAYKIWKQVLEELNSEGANRSYTLTALQKFNFATRKSLSIINNLVEIFLDEFKSDISENTEAVYNVLFKAEKSECERLNNYLSTLDPRDISKLGLNMYFPNSERILNKI